MSLINTVSNTGAITREELRIFTLLLCPFAPHVAEEVWEANALGTGFASLQPWPQYEEALCREDTVERAVQVNGKLRARLNLAADIQAADAIAAAKADGKIAAAIEGKQTVKEIYVPGKLVNLVVK